MHLLEQKARAAGEAYLAAKKEAEAVGFRVHVQGDVVVISGGPARDDAPAPKSATIPDKGPDKGQEKASDKA